MKKLLSFVLCLVTMACLAQNPTLQWKRSYPGNLSGNETVTCSTRDNVSINYVAGYNESYTFISKFDNTGALIQTFEYVDQSNAYVIPQNIFVDNSGNMYLVTRDATVLKFNSSGALVWENRNTTYSPSTVEASTTDISGTPAYIFYTGSFNNLMGVVKVNLSTGATTWANYLNPVGNNYSIAYDIAYNGGNVYATGLTNSAAGDAAYTVKLNSLGAIAYQHTGSTGISETSLRLEVNTSGDAFVFGKTSSTGREEVYLRKITNAGAASWTTITNHTAPNDISNIAAIDLAANPSFTTFFMVYKAVPPPNTFIFQLCEFDFAVNSAGTIVLDNYNSSSYPQPLKVKADNAGNFYVLGTSLAGTKSMYVRKFNSFPSPLYFSTYILNNNQSAPDAPSDLNFDNSGNIYVSASGSPNPTNLRDAVIVKFNQSGNLLWENLYNGSRNTKEFAAKLFLTESKANVMSIGETQSNFTRNDVIAKMHDLQGNEIWSSIIDINLEADMFVNGDKDNDDNLFLQFTSDTTNNFIAALDSLGNQLFSTALTFRPKGFHLNKTNSEVFLGNENKTGSDVFEIKAYLNTGVNSFNSATNAVAIKNAYCDDIWQDGSGNVYACGTILNTSLSSREIQVQKFSPAGALIWTQTIPNLNVLSQPKSFIRINSAGQIICISNTQTSTGTSNAVITTVYGATGAFVNQYAHGGTAGDAVKLQGAKIDGNDIYFYGSKGPGAGTLYQGVVAKLNSTPALVWEKEFTTSVINYKDDKVYDIFIDATSVTVAGTKFTSSSLSNAFLAKLDPNGNQIWETEPTSNYEGENKLLSVAANNSRVYTSGTINDSKGLNGDYAVYKYCDNTLPTVLNSTSNVVCSNQNSTLTSSVSSASYLWSPGNQTTQSINITQTGNYFVTNIEADGCQRTSDTLTISIKPAPVAPSICLVTVDSVSTHNIVVWDKTTYTDVDHFRIYREDFTNIYNLVGVVDYDSLSEFHDVSANPNVTTKRYKLSAVDTCGQESTMSNYHNTLYIAYVGNGQYIWNPLYTIENTPNPVTQYILMRDDNSTGAWNQVASTAGTQNTLTDPAFASFPNGKWRVETAWSITCLSTRGAINTSRSNIRTPTSIGINDNLFAAGIQIYPNPSKGLITIESALSSEKSSVNVYNVLGELVYSYELTGSSTTLDLQHLTSGVYTLNISNHDQSVTRKIVLEN